MLNKPWPLICLLSLLYALSACGGGDSKPAAATSTTTAHQWDDTHWDEGEWQ